MINSSSECNLNIEWKLIIVDIYEVDNKLTFGGLNG